MNNKEEKKLSYEEILLIAKETYDNFSDHIKNYPNQELKDEIKSIPKKVCLNLIDNMIINILDEVLLQTE